MLAVTELTDRLDVVGRLDGAIGLIKQRRRGHTTGSCWSGSRPRSWLAGEDFSDWTGPRQRADAAGQQLASVPGRAR
jgi:hypothetical protein